MIHSDTSTLYGSADEGRILSSLFASTSSPIIFGYALKPAHTCFFPRLGISCLLFHSRVSTFSHALVYMVGAFRLLSKCERVSFPATNRLLPQDAVLSLFSNSRCGATLPSHLHLPGASRGRRPQRPHSRRSRSWDCRRCDTCRAPVPWHPLWEAARPWSPIRPSAAGTAVWRTERDRDAP